MLISMAIATDSYSWNSASKFLQGTFDPYVQLNLDYNGVCDAKRYLNTGYEYPGNSIKAPEDCSICSGAGTDGIGTAIPIPDGQDPFHECDDSNVCTDDGCTAGSCSNINLPAGTECDVGLVCDGNGDCSSSCNNDCNTGQTTCIGNDKYSCGECDADSCRDWCLAEACGSDYCGNFGNWYCQDAVTKRQDQTCHDMGCSGGSCYDTSYTYSNIISCTGSTTCSGGICGGSCDPSMGASCGGSVCVNSGTISCSGSCTGTSYKSSGTSCGSGKVCDGSGNCVSSCVSNLGASCGGSVCVNSGTISCSGSCTGTSYKSSGTSCGSGKVCDGSGNCVSSCVPNMGASCGGSVCVNSGTISCSGSCTGTSYKSSGTSCGSGKVCDGSGNCVSSCVPNMGASCGGGACVNAGTISCGGSCTGTSPKASGTDCGLCAECNGAGSCSQVPADDPSCGTIDCDGMNYYYTSGSPSATTTNYCAFRDYDDITIGRCEGLGDCKDANTGDCISHSDPLVASCGTCKYATGACSSCTNYPSGTSCGTGKECDGNGNCLAITGTWKYIGFCSIVGCPGNWCTNSGSNPNYCSPGTTGFFPNPDFPCTNIGAECKWTAGYASTLCRCQ